MRRIIHVIECLTLGGSLRAVENHIARRSAIPALIGFRGEETCVRDIRAGGVECAILESEEERNAYFDQQDVEQTGVMIHRSGFETPEWNRLLAMLWTKGFHRTVECNVFGYGDRGEAAQAVRKICYTSMHSLWRVWREFGSPPIAKFLERHCVLYNPVTISPYEEEVSRLRRLGRERFAVPQDAFVIGDVCRPAPEKLDAMLLGTAGALLRRIPNLWVVTRSYPESIARALRWRLGSRYLNLPMAAAHEEVLQTLCMMDVFVHMSTMGESFGMANVEAMRCGIPIVCNETPGPQCNNAQRELIQDGATGFFANDPTRLVDILCKLAAHPDRAREIGAAARLASRAGALDPQVVEANLLGHLFDDDAVDDWQAPSKAEITAYLESYDEEFLIPPRRVISPLAATAAACQIGWRAYRKFRKG